MDRNYDSNSPKNSPPPYFPQWSFTRDEGISREIPLNNKLRYNLNEYRKESKFTDFEIRVHSKYSKNTRIFPVHKVILSASSLYFEAMFKNSIYFIENSNNFVEIKEIDNPEVIETILNYFYTGEIEIESHNVQDIVHISSLFQLNDLMEFCVKFLESNLQAYNCVGVLCFADFYSLSKLSFEAKRYIENNFAEIIKEDEYLELPANLFKSFLRSENLSIDSEYQVLLATIEWIRYKYDERLEYFSEFIQIIRVPIIPRDLILLLCEKLNDYPDLVKTLESCIKLDEKNSIDNLVNDNDDNDGGYSSVRCKPRMSIRRPIYLIGGQGFVGRSGRDTLKTLCSIEKYNVHTASWNTCKSLLFPRSQHCAVLLDRKIYVFGGLCDSLILDTIEIIDPIANNAILGGKLMMPRADFGVCVHGSYIYVFGGGGRAGICIEQYNPSDYTCIIYDYMPTKRSSMQVVEHDGLIYIIGGEYESKMITNSVISYNPDTKTFQQLSPMNEPRKNFAAIIMHNYIYVFGGISEYNILSSVEQYDIKYNKWSYVTDLPGPSANLCGVSINNLCYVYGGKVINHKPVEAGKKVLVYDPEQNQWFTGKPMRQGRKDAVAVV